MYDISSVVGGMDYLIKEGTSEYTYHLWITSGLLIVGIGGYNLLTLEQNRKTLGIYYACGMPWKKAKYISFMSNGIIFLVGGLLGSIWGLYGAAVSRTVNFDTIVYSSLTSMLFVSLLFFTTNYIMLNQMSKQNPVEMIKREGSK